MIDSKIIWQREQLTAKIQGLLELGNGTWASIQGLKRNSCTPAERTTMEPHSRNRRSKLQELQTGRESRTCMKMEHHFAGFLDSRRRRNGKLVSSANEISILV
jgi:hypothetical protein